MNETMIKKLQALAENQEFTEKMQDVTDTEAMISLLKEYGVEATEAELVQVLSFSEVADGELDEDMLEGVSGGGKIWNWIISKLNKKNERDIWNLAH